MNPETSRHGRPKWVEIEKRTGSSIDDLVKRKRREGAGYEKIASDLGISDSTLRSYRQHGLIEGDFVRAKSQPETIAERLKRLREFWKDSDKNRSAKEAIHSPSAIRHQAMATRARNGIAELVETARSRDLLSYLAPQDQFMIRTLFFPRAKNIKGQLGEYLGRNQEEMHVIMMEYRNPEIKNLDLAPTPLKVLVPEDTFNAKYEIIECPTLTEMARESQVSLPKLKSRYRRAIRKLKKLAQPLTSMQN